VEDEKVTVKVAAKALNVTPRTVRRYIEKGLITRIKEADRVYVSMDSVRSFLGQQGGQQKADMSQARPQNEDRKADTAAAVIPLDRTHYEGLLTRLGALEAERKYLLEYQTTNEELKKRVAELEQQLTRRSWWRRLWRKD
jgi:DNA-binding transcriptional MerR regulator